MPNETIIAPLLQRYFTDRLLKQKRVSPNTISAYRDTFRLLVKYLSAKLRKPPSAVLVEEITAPVIIDFLGVLEKERNISARTRNLRLSAIRSFFRYLSFELPTHAGQIQQVLAIPSKRYTRKLVNFLSRDEAEALLRAPDLNTWSGKRDHALILLALQTGLRLSELTSIKRDDICLQNGAHVRVCGKGRKERCTPLARRTVLVLRAWRKEPTRSQSDFIFTSIRGGRLTSDAVQYMVDKHFRVACTTCRSLTRKQVTPHVLRHTAAMELLKAGVDRTVIALWLGHESIQTTQMYLDVDMTMKEEALAKVRPIGEKAPRYKPGDELLAFLRDL